MSTARIAELKEELALLEAAELQKKKARLWATVSNLTRPDMQLLRDMLTECIKATYDGDDE